ncbi:MAG: rhomboid family intramembrane serine protease [Polyangiaceae bacterium]
MEKVLARLERRFGNFAVPNLTSFLVGGMALVYVLASMRPSFAEALTLDLAAVRHGQVWRLVTYLFLPTSDSLIGMLFDLYILWMVGSNLEQEWGSFKFNLYYLFGMIGTTIAAAIVGGAVGNVWLNWSLYLAFATMFPEYEIFLFFFLCVRVKWLGLALALYLVFELAMGSWSTRAAIVAALVSYFIFFSGRLVDLLRQRNLEVRQTARRAESRPPPPIVMAGRACAICKITEEDGADIRVCTCEKCGGKPRELCLQHARNH